MCINNYVILIILIIIIYFSIYHNKSNNCSEHYDARMSDITLTQCGTECTKALNCSGFGYKPIKKLCYISKTPILGSPENSLYKDEYTKLDRRCNKINRIQDEDRIDGLSLTSNSIYVCSDGENNVSTEFQYANEGATSLDNVKSTIFDRSDTDRLRPTEVNYDTYDIKYPNEKNDLIPSFELNKFVDPKKVEKKYGFIESDKEYLGQYALAHQCVVNVPLYSCLKYCENNDKCAGTEWNKTLIKTDGENNYLYENVCCPKGIISKVIPRRNKFNRGKFYVKKPLESIARRDNIVMTQAILNKELPINDKFKLSMTDFSKIDINDPYNQSKLNSDIRVI